MLHTAHGGIVKQSYNAMQREHTLYYITNDLGADLTLIKKHLKVRYAEL